MENFKSTLKNDKLNIFLINFLFLNNWKNILQAKFRKKGTKLF